MIPPERTEHTYTERRIYPLGENPTHAPTTTIPSSCPPPLFFRRKRARPRRRPPTTTTPPLQQRRPPRSLPLLFAILLCTSHTHHHHQAVIRAPLTTATRLTPSLENSNWWAFRCWLSPSWLLSDCTRALSLSGTPHTRAAQGACIAPRPVAAFGAVEVSRSPVSLKGGRPKERTNRTLFRARRRLHKRGSSPKPTRHGQHDAPQEDALADEAGGGASCR